MFNSLDRMYSTISIDLTAEKLDLRKKALNDFKGKINKDEIVALVSFYYGVETQTTSIDRLISCICSQDTSFSEKSREELILLIGALLYHICRHNDTYNSFVELLIAINSKIRTPVGAVYYQDNILAAYNSDRKKIRNQKFSNLFIEVTSLDEYLDSLIQGEKCDYQKLKEAWEDTKELLRQDTEDITDVLYEDSQILWWYNSKWNTLDNKPLMETDSIGHCIYLGREVASFVRKYPGPYSIEGIISQVVSSCNGRKSKAKLPEVLKGFDEKSKQEIIQKYNLKPLEKLLPLHTAITLQYNTQTEEEWYPKFKRELKISKEFELSLSNYSYIMYLEELAIACFTTSE